MKVLVAGDFCDKLRVSEYIKNKDYSSLFDSVKPIIERANYSIVNFEFPIVLDESKPIPKCGPNLRGQKEAIDAIKYAGFNVCTLANNHILDQGEQCCLDTKRLIEESRIKTVGAGKNIEEAGAILYLKSEGETLAIINCCEHEFSFVTESSAGANPFNPIQQFYKIQEAKSNADYILVIVHGGCEHYQYPSIRMQETYRFFIDCGVTAVINHHQHCFSGYEVYKGKPIVYGLGNLLFDHLKHRKSQWNEGYMVTLDFVNNNVSFELHPYTQCGETVSVTPMQNAKKELFELKIQSINNVIDDKITLENEFYTFCQRQRNNYLSLLEPYNNRLMKGLRKLKLLPSFITEKKRLQILNYIMCESHVERFVNVLKNYE